MNISIVIPNYNGAKIMRENLPLVLEAVRDYKDGTVEIIIADDPSTDNSQEVIAEFIKSIKQKHIIGKTISNKNRHESGFSKNVNRGTSLATGDILILFNTDVVPHKDFLKPLLKHFSDEKVFAVGCMDESVEAEGIVQRGRGIGHWARGFLVHEKGELNNHNTLWVSGGSSAFRKSIWDRLHGLDPLFNPFYWEDIDLSYRALKSGYKIYFEKESVVVHEHDKGAIKTAFKSDHIKTIAYRNQLLFVWKNITDLRLMLSHLFWLPYYFLRAIIHNDKNFLRGFVKALSLFSQMQYSRNKARKNFVLSDEELLASYKK